MSRNKTEAFEGFILFDAIYEDGIKSSWRRVPAPEIVEHGVGYARTAIMN